MNSRKSILAVLALVLIAGAIAVWIFRAPPRETPPPYKVNGTWEYCVGIYTGTCPWILTPGASNPVLSCADVTDVPGLFTADPFMIQKDGTWYLFTEVFNGLTHQGDIGVATSPDGFKWKYQQIVLDEPFHLSYPCVFEWQNQYYMVPESYEANAIRLYKADPFPTHWTFVTNIVAGQFVDSTPFHYKDMWYIFAGRLQNSILHLFYSPKLEGPWVEHPKSPVVNGNLHHARAGGHVIEADGRVFRYTQDCGEEYGTGLRVFEITKLTTTEYEEHEMPTSPVLWASGHGWNADGMHQCDVHPRPGGGWFACVDGCNHSAPPDHWTHVAFANGISLEGYSLRPAGPVKPGQSVVASFYWSYGTNSACTNIVAFVHAEKKHTRFQGDHALPAQEDMSRSILKVPADAGPGEYKIAVGLYDTTSKKRLPLKTNFHTEDRAVILPTSLIVNR